MTNDRFAWQMTNGRFAWRMTESDHFFFGFGLEPNSPASPFFGGGGGGAAGFGGGALGGPFRMVESIPGFLGAGAGLGFAAGGGGGGGAALFARLIGQPRKTRSTPSRNAP